MSNIVQHCLTLLLYIILYNYILGWNPATILDLVISIPLPTIGSWVLVAPSVPCIAMFLFLAPNCWRITQWYPSDILRNLLLKNWVPLPERHSPQQLMVALKKVPSKIRRKAQNPRIWLYISNLCNDGGFWSVDERTLGPWNLSQTEAEPTIGFLGCSSKRACHHNSDVDTMTASSWATQSYQQMDKIW